MNRSWFLLPQSRTENRYALSWDCLKAAAFSKKPRRFQKILPFCLRRIASS
ncbi:hypothetical protein LB526_12100 [Mesorhizobium sp. CA6]|uniref:hypothetical protein n=1 Tax=Mesorhizobium sp. CA6 TaxID=588500 RepID=UPI001CCDD836|nr:hypothetical protein [Mesorhizobium sp. CA6]MBZ9767501.1 hypothetical protein [Mesorhizobium sp. CA6]